MRCEDCPYRLAPFFTCKKYGWTLKEHPEVVGCNIDGELPPIPAVVPPNSRGSLLKESKE